VTVADVLSWVRMLCQAEASEGHGLGRKALLSLDALRSQQAVPRPRVHEWGNRALTLLWQ